MLYEIMKKESLRLDKEIERLSKELKEYPPGDFRKERKIYHMAHFLQR